MQPCSSYSKVFWGCSCVSLFLLCAALFFILKGFLGLLSRGLFLLYAAPFFIFKGVFGFLLRRLVLALCSPVLHIQKCFLAAHVWGLPRFYAAPSTLDDAIGYRCSMLIMANRQTSRDVCTANVRRHQSAYHAFLVFTLVRGSL